MCTVREIIIASGRFGKIMDFISVIMERPDKEFPVRTYYTDDSYSTASSYVSMENVKKGVVRWLQLIDVDEFHLNITDDDKKLLGDFGKYVDSVREMEMLNYANACAHREKPNESVLEYIRVLSVLSSSIDYFVFELYIGYDEDYNFERFDRFDIPEGWKKARK